MDRFSLMNTFARVAEARSFTKAAASLGVSRATVSLAVRELEEQLGARLLHRTTRSVSLTPEGQLYYESAREVLAKIETTDQLFQARRPRVSGRLTVDVPTRIARRLLIPALPDFLAQHPGLQVRLGASDRTINLVEKGVDAVIRVGPLPDSSHIARSLGSLTLINCASPRYLARRGQPRSLDDLSEHVAVAYSPSFTGTTSWDYVVSSEQRAVPIRSVVTVDNAETYIAACLAGLGLIQIPAYDVQHHLESGALVSVLPNFTAAPLPIWLVYPSRKQPPTRLEAFATWITSVFSRHGLLTSAVPSLGAGPSPSGRTRQRP